MSWEAWGTPPYPPPQFCPNCGNQERTDGCSACEADRRAAEDQARALRRLFTEATGLQVLQAAGDEIWHNLRKWGDPSQRDNHSIGCGCTYCT